MQIFKIVIWPLFKAIQKSGQMTILKNLHVYLLLHQSLYDISSCSYQSTWPQLDISPCSYQSTWPQLDISPCSYQSTWPQLDINSWSYLFTCSFGCRLISALVLTSHLKCQTTLLILLCLAAPFFNGPRLFLFSISYIFGVNILKLIHYLCRAGDYYNFYSGFC